MSAERGKATSSEQSSKSVTGLGKKEKPTPGKNTVEREKKKFARGHARSKQWAAELLTGRMRLELLLAETDSYPTTSGRDAVVAKRHGRFTAQAEDRKRKQSKSCHSPAFTVAPRDPIFR